MPASSVQDVINGWNAVCSQFSFSSCPSSSTIATMASTYSGSSYSSDSGKFMAAIGEQVLALHVPDAPGEELVSAVLNDPAWYAS